MPADETATLLQIVRNNMVVIPSSAHILVASYPLPQL